VLVSLAEAETIRCILHLRQGKEAVEGCDTAMAMRCVCANNIVLDASDNFVAGSAYQESVAYNSFRFFNSDTHYKSGEINVLLREIPEVPLSRRFFFTAMVACRRRLAKRWEQTPLAKLFTLEDQWSLLKQRAQAVRMREGLSLFLSVSLSLSLSLLTGRREPRETKETPGALATIPPKSKRKNRVYVAKPLIS